MNSDSRTGSRAGLVFQAPMPDHVVLGHLLPHYHAAQEWQDTVRRLRAAGPVADASPAAQVRRTWTQGTGRSTLCRRSIIAVTATASRRWLRTHLIAVGHWLAGTSPSQPGEGDEDIGLHCRQAG